MEILNIYKKIQKARVMLQASELKKSGFNKFSNFNYFELKDFLPRLNEIMAELGLFSTFNILTKTDDLGVSTEQAILIIYNSENEEKLSFYSSTADGTGNVEIQKLGAKQTYLKRYLYLNAFEIAENDIVDASDTKAIKEEKKTEKKVETKATEKQISMVKSLYSEEELAKMLANLNKEITELTVSEASTMIAKRKEQK